MNEIIVILIITALLVTFVNLFCITVICYTKRLHKAAHLAISSLLLAHLLQGLLVIPSYAVKRSKITTDHIVCDLFRFTYFLTNYASCLTLVLISLDRCLSVIIPLRYKIWITQKRMLIWISGTWIYILCLCIIPFVLGDHTKCSYHPSKAWTLVMLLGHTMIPFIIVLSCYAIIFSKVKIVLQQRQTQRRLARRKQWDKSKTTIIIVFFYILCWGPSFVYYTTLMLCPKDVCFTDEYLNSDREGHVTFSMKYLTFADGIIAPLLYCFSNQSFCVARKRFVRKLKLFLFPNDLDHVTTTHTNGLSMVTDITFNQHDDDHRSHETRTIISTTPNNFRRSIIRKSQNKIKR